MSAEHRLTGFYGKHPAFGDFVSAGLPGETTAPLADWMQAAFGQWREAAGPGWEAQFDEAAPVRFWIGAGLTGTALRGVWLPSQDRSGRRFPLMILQSAGLAPVQDHDQGFYEQAIAHLADWRHQAQFDPAERLAEIQDLPAPQGGAAANPGFWAANPRLHAAGLWAEVAAADHAHAAQGRSYWWISALKDQGPSALIAVQGWPDSGLLGWLLAGAPAPAEQDHAKVPA